MLSQNSTKLTTVKKIYINLSPSLLQQIDDLAQHNSLSRSAQMRMALASYVRQPDNVFKLKATARDPNEDVQHQQFKAEWLKQHPEAKLKQSDLDLI